MSAKFDFSRLGKPFEADWPVSVPVPQDGGTVAAETFMARFRQLPGTEIDEAVKRDDFDIKTLTRMFFIGFGQGESQTFSDDLREKMLDVVYVRDALNNAYKTFTSGIAVKN